jgi:hypothetical protein
MECGGVLNLIRIPVILNQQIMWVGAEAQACPN